MTTVPPPPLPLAAAGGPDFLDRLRSSRAPRPGVDQWAAGGLRAWLEDVVVSAGAGGGGGRVVVRDGMLVPSMPRAPRVRRVAGGRHEIGPAGLCACLVRVTFRLTVTVGPPRHPLEDSLSAISVAERGPDVLDAVRRLRTRERAALRAALRSRAATMAADWRPVPHAWLPRTGERLQVPLAGGAVVLGSTADLVLGRPSAGSASVCMVRVQVGRGGAHGVGSESPGAGDAAGEDDLRALRALALAETLRSGARPWRVASYDASSGRLRCEDSSDELLVAGVDDVLGALERARSCGQAAYGARVA